MRLCQRLEDQCLGAEKICIQMSNILMKKKIFFECTLLVCFCILFGSYYTKTRDGEIAQLVKVLGLKSWSSHVFDFHVTCVISMYCSIYIRLKSKGE